MIKSWSVIDIGREGTSLAVRWSVDIDIEGHMGFDEMTSFWQVVLTRNVKTERPGSRAALNGVPRDAIYALRTTIAYRLGGGLAHG